MTKTASGYPMTIYGRIVNPGTEDEYMVTGEEPSEVSDDHFGSDDTLSPRVARYILVGVGEIKYTAPRYVEEGLENFKETSESY